MARPPSAAHRLIWRLSCPWYGVVNGGHLYLGAWKLHPLQHVSIDCRYYIRRKMHTITNIRTIISTLCHHPNTATPLLLRPRWPQNAVIAARHPTAHRTVETTLAAGASSPCVLAAKAKGVQHCLVLLVDGSPVFRAWHLLSRLIDVWISDTS